MLVVYFNLFKLIFSHKVWRGNVDALKDALKSEIVSNIEFYQQFSSESVDVIREINSFPENPMKYYVSDTVDLFVDAIAKTLPIKGKIYQIYSSGNIVEIDVGCLTEYAHEFYFVRYSFIHVDPVLTFDSSDDLSDEIEEIDDKISRNEDKTKK